MQLEIRRLLTAIDHKGWEAGRAAEPPLRRVAITAILHNPWAGRYVEDLGPGIAASAEVGAVMARAGLEAMAGYAIESYGKGGVVGTAGEQEHANALLTTTFAEPLRLALGGALAWIPSFTKLAAPGASSERIGATCEKHTGLSTAAWSLQLLKLTLKPALSNTAPTDSACAVQAGDAIPGLKVPEA
jgi:hypothetical protein